MKNFMMFLMLLMLANISYSQHKYDNNKRHSRHRFEELEKIKLLEALDLDEEIAIKFFTRRSKSKKLIKQILKESDLLFENLEESIQEEKKDNYDKLISQINGIEQKVNNEKMNFISSLDDILTKEQIAKVLLFEYKFKRDIRKLLLERGKKKYFKK